MPPRFQHVRRLVAPFAISLLLTSDRIGLRAAEPADYLIRTWGAEDGLRSEAIFSIAQDRDGYLWNATSSGLARFDGVRFTVFDSDNTPALGTRAIYSVEADRQGRLWLRNQHSEAIIRERGQFQRITVPQGPNGQPAVMQGLREDHGGNLWIHTSLNQRVLWTPGTTNFGAPSSTVGEPVLIPSAGDEEDWFALADPATKSTRVGRKRDGRFMTLADPSGRSEFDTPTYFPHHGGGTWMLEGAGRERTLRLLQPNGVISAPRPLPRLSGDPPNSFVEDRAGNIWVGFREAGVLRISASGEQRTFTRDDGLASNNIRQMLVDREGNVWAATDGGGLTRFTPRRFQIFGRADGLPSEIIYSVTAAPAAGGGGLWIGTHGGGVVSLQNGRFSRQPGFDPFPWAVHVASDDTLWVGDLMAGLAHLRSEKPTWLVRSTQINALCNDPAGGGWAGGNGLIRWRDDIATPVTNWPAARTISSLASSRDGVLWLGTINEGLWRGENGVFHRVDPTENPKHRDIQSLYVDAGGILWIGTGGSGLLRLRDGQFTEITESDGLADRSILGIAEDELGNFWFTSLGGIFRIARKDLENFCAGQSADVVAHQFDREDGLVTGLGTSDSQAKIARTSDGRMWFATMHGLASTDPRAMQINTNPPPVVIEELRADGQSLDLQSGATPVIAPGARRIEIHFTALSFTGPGKVRFRYRLEGRDDRWIDGGTHRFAAFDGLGPGEHQFRVLACNNDGVWNDAGATLAFEVAPFFWETSAFRSSVGAAALIFGVWGVRFVSLRKVRRRLAQLERQQAINHERARIARDMHDDVGSALTQLTLLGSPHSDEPETPPQTEARLGQVTELSREIVGKLDELVWTVNPRHDTTTGLVDYLCHHAETTARAAGLRLRYDIAPGISALPVASDRRHQLFLAYKEALSNVVKHAKATLVHLRFRVEDGVLRVIIEDDGRGFDPAVASGDGDGLLNMRERLAAIGGATVIVRSETGGTRVEFSLPLADT